MIKAGLFVSVGILFPFLLLGTVRAGGGLDELPVATGAVGLQQVSQTDVTVTGKSPANFVSTSDKNSPSGSVKDLVLGLIGGWLLSFLGGWVMEKLKEPQLEFEVGSVSETHPTNLWRFIHIRIKNKRSWIFSRETAYSCKAIVKLGNLEFVGRWASKAEPITQFPGGSILNINEILVHPREDIQPSAANSNHEAVEVPIGLKYEGETEFSAFNNESYAHPNLKCPQRQFSANEVEGQITILTAGKKFTRKFRVFNLSASRKDFYLELN